MTTPKAIFFDIDGTLLNHGQMPESAKMALKYARDKGVLLFIATGRHRDEINRIAVLPDLAFDGFVSLNGGYCYTDNSVIFRSPINKESVHMVVDYISHNPFPCMFCEEHGMFINFINEKAKAIHTALDLAIPPICAPARALDLDIFQIVTLGNHETRDFLKKLPSCTITSWEDDCYDIVPSTVNKWKGILRIAEHFGLKSNEIATIGDNLNDMEMLTNAEYSVAMGNSSDIVKKCAKFVTTNINDDGILNAIKHLLQ